MTNTETVQATPEAAKMTDLQISSDKVSSQSFEYDESIVVVEHDLEYDAYVSEAITDEQLGAGIVIVHADKEDINFESMVDPEEYKQYEERMEEIEFPEEVIAEIAREEVVPVDIEEVKESLDKAYELYDEDSIRDLLLEQVTEPNVFEDVVGDDLISYCSLHKVPVSVKRVYSKYNCIPIKEGGPIGIKSFAASCIRKDDLDDSFYIVDISNVNRLFTAWSTAMPRVTPFYAVKCCPMPPVIDLLAANGCGFDCASAAEIQLVLNAGVTPDRIIFAHPAKRPADIRFAAEKGVTLTTFDSRVELEKIAKWHPNSECVLRIRADDPTAGISFGIKFGAAPDEVEVLLELAKTLGLEVVGVSFHVGSMAKSGLAFHEAIKQARTAFDIATRLGHKMRLLDIGGGYVGRFNSMGIVQSMVGQIPASINDALDIFFGESTPFADVKVIAEPGRYFAEACMHLCCHVHSFRNRVDPTDGNEFCDYLISDGLYGSFNAILYDGAKPRAWLLPGPSLPPLDERLERSTVFGPTCDSMDCVFKNVMLPQLRVGDWLLFPHFGAYTLAGATNFNGIQSASPKIHYVVSDSAVDEVDSLIMWACEMENKPSPIVAQ